VAGDVLAVDSDVVARRLKRFATELEHLHEAPTAEAAARLLDESRRAAAGHPTPQSRMAASGLTVAAGEIIGHPSTTVHGTGGPATLGGGFGFGAISGGDRRHGLAAPRRGGYWLIPQARAMGDYLEPITDVVRTEIRRVD
jgi:hypothetical protein